MQFTSISLWKEWGIWEACGNMTEYELCMRYEWKNEWCNKEDGRIMNEGMYVNLNACRVYVKSVYVNVTRASRCYCCIICITACSRHTTTQSKEICALSCSLPEWSCFWLGKFHFLKRFKVFENEFISQKCQHFSSPLVFSFSTENSDTFQLK